MKPIDVRMLSPILEIRPEQNWPYQNQWKHWVWRDRPDQGELTKWPGLKPPVKGATPKLIDNRWWWTTPM